MKYSLPSALEIKIAKNYMLSLGYFEVMNAVNWELLSLKLRKELTRHSKRSICHATTIGYRNNPFGKLTVYNPNKNQDFALYLQQRSTYTTDHLRIEFNELKCPPHFHFRSRIPEDNYRPHSQFSHLLAFITLQNSWRLWEAGPFNVFGVPYNVDNFFPKNQFAHEKLREIPRNST